MTKQEKTGHTPNRNNQRVIGTEEAIDAAIVELTIKHLDEPPFSAREVARLIGKENSHAMITRDRDGLKGYLIEKRHDFVVALSKLVEAEQQNHGKISITFCFRLGKLIVSYQVLFAVDIISHSHRNIEYLVEEVSPLVHEKKLGFFGTEVYRLLSDWQEDQFTKESIGEKYSMKLQHLFHYYQITRPDIGIPKESSTATLPERQFF